MIKQRHYYLCQSSDTFELIPSQTRQHISGYLPSSLMSVLKTKKKKISNAICISNICANFQGIRFSLAFIFLINFLFIFAWKMINKLAPHKFKSYLELHSSVFLLQGNMAIFTNGKIWYIYWPFDYNFC